LALARQMQWSWCAHAPATEIVSVCLEFAFATNSGTAAGAVGGSASAPRAAVSFADVCAAKYSPPAPTAVPTIASALANSGAFTGKTATTITPSTKAAGKSSVTNLPNFFEVPLSLAGPAPEMQVQVSLPSRNQGVSISSVPGSDASTAHAGLPSNAGLSGVPASGPIAQSGLAVQFPVTGAISGQGTQVSSPPEVHGQGEVPVEAAPDSSSSRPSSTRPSWTGPSSASPSSTLASSTMASSSNGGSADLVSFASSLESSVPQVPAAAGEDSQAASFFNDQPSGTQNDGALSQPMATPALWSTTPEATIAASTSAQFPSPAKPVALSSTDGEDPPAETSANPSLVKMSDMTPASTQAGAVATAQILQNSAPPPVTLFAAAQESLQNSVAFPAVVAAAKRAANATPQGLQPAAQKTPAGIARFEPSALTASLHSAVARSIVEFSDEKVVAPPVATAPHSSAGANLQTSFSPPAASLWGDRAAADTTASAAKNTASAPAAGSGSANADVQSARGNNDAQSGGSGNSSPDGRHKETAATEPVVTAGQTATGQTATGQTATGQTPASVPIPVVAAVDPASDAVPAPAAPPAAPQSGSGSSNSAEASANRPAANFPAAATATPVQIAQMVNTAAQSEMRIGMNTANFGSVEVRAVVHAGDVGVLIGSEKGDLRSALATEIPGIANTLEQQNLRLAPVSFQQHGFAFSSDLSSGGQSQARSFSSKPNFATGQQPEPASAEPDPQPERSRPTSSRGLSILA